MVGPSRPQWAHAATTALNPVAAVLAVLAVVVAVFAGWLIGRRPAQLEPHLGIGHRSCESFTAANIAQSSKADRGVGGDDRV